MANITKREAIKSIVLSALTGIITTVITSLNAGAFPTMTEIKPALFAALATLLAALLKYFTTDTVESAKEDMKAAMKPGEIETVVKPVGS